jgi:hypothetical protein
MSTPTVIISVYGGVVQDVECPAGIDYEVKDYDNCRECTDDDQFYPCPDYCREED